MEKIRVILPEKYDLVVGDTFQLFYRGVVEAPDPFCYDIIAICECGKNLPRYFEFTPEKPGKHKLAIYVYNAAKKLLGKAETILNVASPKQPEKSINVLCVGDSLTRGGEWVNEVSRRLSSNDGAPKGLNFKNINFLGSCGNETVSYEGYGGWRWDSYLSDHIEDVWVECEHNKTSADQHSLWNDCNGNVWKLETIDDGKLKFIPVNNNSISILGCKALLHNKNAVNKEDIIINDIYIRNTNPFFDEKKSEINIKGYAKKHGAENIDVFYILLGVNGVDSFDSLDKLCKSIVNDGKRLVDKLHRDFPDAKIKVMGYPIPSQNGGCGANYGATLPYCDDYGFARFIMELNLCYSTWAKEKSYSNFLEFINISGQFDSDYGFPKIEKPVNVRSTHKELLDANGVHPNNEGYMQIADAVFRNMVHLLVDLQEKPCH